VAQAVTGEKTSQQAMDNLAREQDRVLERLERANVQDRCGPRLNEERSREYWLQQPGAPKPELDNEKPQGKTIAYDKLIKTWEQGNEAQ
jgi:glycerol transport system substrate-binding protein